MSAFLACSGFAYARSPSMRIVITGANGSIGTALVKECIVSPQISHIVLLVRSELPSTFPQSPKITVLKHGDFSNYPPSLIAQLRNLRVEACIWCLGTSSARVAGRVEYARITKDFTLAAATTLCELSPQFRFVYTSLPGASAKSW